MDLKCIVCHEYYFVDENLEPGRAMGPHICSPECFHKSQTKTDELVELEQSGDGFVIGVIGED